MPLPMVHLGVAKYFVDHASQQFDAPMFYLGSISPDAIHKRINPEPNAKSISHLFAEGDNWSKNVMDFYESNAADLFALGYCIHIITDIFWRDTLNKEYQEKYNRDKSAIQDLRMAYYNDTDQLDLVLFNTCSWRKEIWDLLESAQVQPLEGLVSSDEVEAWKQRTLRWYDSGESEHKNPIKYITVEDLHAFIENCGKYVSELFA